MHLSTSQAAAQLGVSARQVRRSAASGRIVATKLGTSHAFSPRQVPALERTAHRGRDWTDAVQRAALDLLATGKTTELSSSERSRLKHRICASDVGTLAGQILNGRVSLRRAASNYAKESLRSSMLLTSELGLSSGGGLSVLIAKDASSAAKRAHLGLDDSGDIAVVEGEDVHRGVLEVLALYTYGDAREYAAAARWISAAQERI
ncbi:hypothetical protein [Cryobacterium sp. MDB2-10]|uniref:hypothetical protein n=1 Tax=Cryobacterium sp. MDB2-10 TaxID=1259177 RepID=UPI001073EE30|nr:hypothetical protein [Cryobacterium sp. MDB2-10]TFC12528.1 hypothetical protein E3O51_18305 [Cryobacterium sp. MDB2-10]